jgi:hypothetical protein
MQYAQTCLSSDFHPRHCHQAYLAEKAEYSPTDTGTAAPVSRRSPASVLTATDIARWPSTLYMLYANASNSRGPFVVTLRAHSFEGK